LPHVHVDVIFGGKMMDITFVLDTGFSGDLKIDDSTANDLGIFLANQTDFTNANGEIISAGFVLGYAEMENRRAPIKIIIVSGSRLAGMGLFMVFGYQAVIDGRKRRAYLERTT
jgi:predicted aspartyl protease